MQGRPSGPVVARLVPSSTTHHLASTRPAAIHPSNPPSFPPSRSLQPPPAHPPTYRPSPFPPHPPAMTRLVHCMHSGYSRSELLMSAQCSSRLRAWVRPTLFQVVRSGPNSCRSVRSLSMSEWCACECVCVFEGGGRGGEVEAQQ